MNNEFWKIAAAIFLPNVGGLANGAVVRRNITVWYKNLILPSYCPPNWVFPIAWTGLYSSMGYASYLVWRDCSGNAKENALLPLLAYGGQLALNWAWTPIFFGMHNIKWALYELMLLTPMASVCGLLFYKVNKLAGYIFIPYVGWLIYATIITYSTHELNKPKKISPKTEEHKLI